MSYGIGDLRFWTGTIDLRYGGNCGLPWQLDESYMYKGNINDMINLGDSWSGSCSTISILSKSNNCKMIL